MKKTYISPSTEVIKLLSPTLLVVSGSGELGAPAASDPMGLDDDFINLFGDFRFF
ncbi:MAG: hypothetical protein K5683_07065 [Prevotella sp.]|nr:hypothetical protein [Prevotella sp.]